ncbi:MAG TPA: hypothetical protein VNR66_13895 [Solirubrobacteraceae bacterium]|nr:hypothetical protein [Solirubrobacteraceae bacterium]
MRSGRAAIGALGSALAVGTLSGCVTTQQKNARAQLIADRTLASRDVIHVTRPNPYVRVTRLALVVSPHGTAVVVRLHNPSAHALTDLPISVGVLSRRGQRVYLNRQANIDYFDTHVPAVAAKSTATWVFTSRRRVAGGSALFADVGVAQSPPPATVSTLPTIEVTRAPESLADGLRGVFRLAVANTSGVPQYGLQVYAVAVRGGRYVGAGRTGIDLAGGDRTTLELTLLGNPTRASISLDALPTIFK